MKGTEHGGAAALRKGETCASCHNDEAADMGKKMASGQKLEPNPIKGKAGSIPVNVQAANDGSQSVPALQLEAAGRRRGEDGQGQPRQAGLHAGRQQG